MAKFRFDDSYCKVYEFNRSQNAYLYLCSYYSAGINPSMDDIDKIQLAELYAQYDIDSTLDNMDAWDMSE